jgi:cell division protein FtsI (penicillin-binding protein 3)
MWIAFIKLAAFIKTKAVRSKRQLQQGYSKKNRYFLLRKNIPFKEYKVLRTFPLLKMDPNKGGFIAEVKRRLTPMDCSPIVPLDCQGPWICGGISKR